MILKAEFSKQPVLESQTADSGVFTAEQMETIIRDRQFELLPPLMAEAVNKCIDAFTKTADPQVIDLILDQAHYGHSLMLAKKSKSPFLQKLLAITIDLINLRVFLRMKLLKKQWEYTKNVLIPGGEIESSFYQTMLPVGFDDFIELDQVIPYGALLEDGIKMYKATGSLAGFEKMCDNYIMTYIKQYEFAAFGIEPLVAYLLAKETEIRNVRIIMVGKINNIAKDVIRERLRDVYV